MKLRKGTRGPTLGLVAMGRVCEEGQDGAGQKNRTNQESFRIYATIKRREAPV